MSEELISLVEVKAHLRIEDDFTEEDDLIRAYIAAAVEVCRMHIGRAIPEDLAFTPAMKVGCLLYIGFLHSTREMVSEVEKTEIPMTTAALWSVYRTPGVY